MRQDVIASGSEAISSFEEIASSPYGLLAMTECCLSLQRSVFDSMWSQILPKLFLHHRFVIGPVADIHPGNRLASEGDDVSVDAVEEPAVVADKQYDACNHAKAGNNNTERNQRLSSGVLQTR